MTETRSPTLISTTVILVAVFKSLAPDGIRRTKTSSDNRTCTPALFHHFKRAK
jgi:hypothetical protein